MPPIAAFAQLIGGSRLPLELEYPTTAQAVYEQAALAVGRPVSSFKLVLKGQPLDPAAADAKVALHDGDCLLVMPQRKPTSARLVNAALDAQRGSGSSHGHQDEDDDDDEEPSTCLPPDAAQWERAVVERLRGWKGCPPQALQWLVFIRPRSFLYLILFMAGCVLSNKFSLGPPFILVTIMVVIFKNLGRRKQGEMSAYSVFNDGVQRLPGQLDADAIDNQIRRGQMM